MMQIDTRVFDLYDEYCHGRIERREFLKRASAVTVAGASGLAMAQALLPRYAQAQTISFTDPRMKGGNDDDGRTLQSGLDPARLRTDMLNSARLPS
jgi:hypothetical protein